MILFLYGKDTYRLKQKVKALKEKFVSASLGDTNLAILDGKTVSYEEMVRQILALPFLSRKRLVIIENLLIEGKKSAQGRDLVKGGDIQEKMGEFLKKVPQETILVFTENGRPDRRSKLFKKLNQPRVSQEFELLLDIRLKNWIKLEVEKRKAKIEPQAVDKLAQYVGSDLWQMSNELDKLAAYSQGKTGDMRNVICDEDVELLVPSKAESNIFTLIESTAGQNTEGAIKELYRLLKNGLAEIYILTMIVYQYRNLLIVKDLLERTPEMSQRDLGQKTKMHPFVLQKTVFLAKKYTFGQLKNIYQRLLDFDNQIKTGKIESRTALELLVFELTRTGENF